MSVARSAIKERRGGAAVELVVVFPFILLLLVGVVDYGRLFYTSVAVANAAHAAAAWGARKGELTAFNVAKQDSVAQADGVDAGSLTITTSHFCECGGAANASCASCSGGVAPEVYIVVTASKAVSMYFPYPGLPGSITISQTAKFRTQ